MKLALPASLTPLKQKQVPSLENFGRRSEEGWDAVVVTGGEPTIMPTFFEAVRESARQEYSKIIIKFNGRRFSYPEFAQQTKNAGATMPTLASLGTTALSMTGQRNNGVVSSKQVKVFGTC